MAEFKRLMVGVDFSPRSLTAAQMAVALASPTEATVEIVHVCEAQCTDADALILGKKKTELQDVLLDEAQAELNNFAGQIGYKKIEVTLLSGSAANQLSRRYIETSADVLVIGDVGARSASAYKGVGVTTYRLVENGPKKVLVVKPGHYGKLNNVAASIDYKSISSEVFEQARDICRITGAVLHVVNAYLNIVEKHLIIVSTESKAKQALRDLQHDSERQLREFVENQGPVDVPIRLANLPGSPSGALTRYLQDEEIDLVVLGTGTSFRLVGYPIGSTTHTVLNEALSSVFVIRSEE